MGVEYEHYLIPRPNSYSPSAIQIGGLIIQLIADKWLWAPENGSSPEVTQRLLRPTVRAEHHPIRFPITINWLLEQMNREQFLLLEWRIHNIVKLGIRYPFPSMPLPPEDIYYSFAIHWSSDYIYHFSDLIVPFDNTNCKCGEDLEFSAANDVFFESRLRAACPSCGREFDPSILPASRTHGWTGEPLPPLLGGATYRFAVVIDCGKAIPDPDGDIRLNPALKESCQRALSCSLSEVGDLS